MEALGCCLAGFPAECLWNILLKPNFPRAIFHFAVYRWWSGSACSGKILKSSPLIFPKNLKKKNGIWRIYSHNNLLIRYFPAILNNPQLWPSPKKRRWSLTTGVFFRSLPRPLGHAWMKRHVGCPTWQRPGLVSTSNCLIGILEMGCYNPNIPWVGWHPLSTLTNQGFLFSLLASPLCLNKHIAMEKSTTLSPNIYKYHQKNGGWFYDVILTSTYRV